jgi:hypothetical protein
MRFPNVGRTSVALSLLVLASPVAAQVVINEVYPNPGSEFDGAEFIELRNKGAGAVNIGNWVIGGTEFDGICAGEDLWQVPAGTMMPAGSYVIFAKDNADTVPGDEDDGFAQRFGFDPDFEFFDPVWTANHDSNDPNVPNLSYVGINSTFDDQVGLWPGVGYGASCSGQFNKYEVLYLWNGNPGGGGTLVDAIEWRDPALCASDICTGVGASNDDAFNTAIGVGESLSRNASSTDTGHSRNDLALGTPTPGATNIANPGPTLSNLLLSNASPKVSQTTDVTITATDAHGIGSGWVVYTVNGGAPDSTSMSLSGANQYTGTIGPFADGAIVTYFVRVYDGGSAAGVGFSKYPDHSHRLLRWGTQSIFAVQFHTPPSDAGGSAEVGKPVNIEGIVTTERGLYNANAFTIQSGSGFWTGVHCFDNLAEANVQRGDSVRVAGTVEEYFGLTEVGLFGAQAVSILSSGNPVPGPNVLSASQLPITTAPPSQGEPWEGVHVRLEDLEVTLPDDGFGQWQVTDVTGTALIGDDAFYLYNPALGDSLVSVSGIVTYSFSERKLEPRDDADIVGPPIIGSIRYTPIPPLAAPSPLKVTAEITDFNGTITTANLKYIVNNDTTTVFTVAMTNPSGNNWEANLSSVVGPEIDYHIEVVDNDGFTARGPSVGRFDLRRGMLSIQTIQSTFAAGSDSSLYARTSSPVNCAGIVTMAPGTLAGNEFVIQNNYTSDPAYRGIQVFTGGTSFVGLVDIGDSVAVSGDVGEYFGMTQVSLHFGEAYTNYGAFAGTVAAIPAFEIDTSDLPPDSTGVVPVSEPFEAVLVIAKSATVTNANAGFGGYYIDNTAPETAEETLVDDDYFFLHPDSLQYEPVLGEGRAIRGVVEFAFGEFKIQPRGDFDILMPDGSDATDVAGTPTTAAFALHQSVPNPFTGSATRIAFALPRASEATLRVFDVAGRLVRTLVSGSLPAGAHVADWDGRNETGGTVANGVYFYRLQAAGEFATKKLILVR